jgi:predicted HAD superfamily hydrolase
MKKELLTIDIWDTLIRRHSHPEFSKLETSQYLFSQKNVQFKSIYTSYINLYKARLDVELEIAKKYLNQGFDDEYSIDEVFETWLKKVYNTTLNNDFIDNLIKFELNFEISNTYKDPTILETIKNLNANRTIFLSDFYMPSSFLKKLLKHHELDNLINDGHSSCDVKLNKRSGNLYKFIFEKYDLNPDQQIHIGDNYYSDVEVPTSLGIQSYHFEPDIEHKKRLEKIKFFENFIHNN